MKTSLRLEGIGEYYFSKKLREIESLNLEGKNIISLGVGSPDQAPHADVIQILQEEAGKPGTHAYQSYKGSPVLRNAMAIWYKSYYDIEVNPDLEILPLAGSKEGIMHICMTYINPGDIVLIPNPGYPTYQSAAKLAGGKLITYELKAENSWKPDFNQLEKLLKNRSPNQENVLMFANYPQMPTGQLPDEKLFEELIGFASKNNVLLIHDNPYSFILNDQPLSIFHSGGLNENVIELNSLSKSHNMAGWRIGMMIANAKHVENVLRFKSNMDSGMFLPIQLAAVKALSLPPSWYASVNELYKKRKDAVHELLDMLGCEYSKEQAGLFVWAKVPDGFSNGYSFSDLLLYDANVFVTPGGIFGTAGDDYIRVSLCAPEEKIRECKSRIIKSGIIKSKQDV